MQRLVGDHDFSGREELHGYILEWIPKMESWSGNDDYISELDVGLQPHFERLVLTVREQRAMQVELDEAVESAKSQRLGIEKGYDAMLRKQKAVSAKKNDTLEMTAAKQKALLEWKAYKLESVDDSLAALKSKIAKLGHQLMSTMDSLIDDAQKIYDLAPDDSDIIMKELEALMEGVTLDDADGGILRSKTLILGQDDSQSPQQVGTPMDVESTQPIGDQPSKEATPANSAEPLLSKA